MLHLNFLNKNTFRNYPLQSPLPISFDGEVELPQALLTSARFSVPSGYEQVFLSRFLVREGYVNILVSSWVSGAAVPIGVFDGVVTEDYTELTLRAFIPSVSGSLTLGRKDVLPSIAGVHTLTNVSGRVEDSLVTVVVPPGVTSITHDNTTLTGLIRLTFSNVREVTNPSSLQLEVITKEAVRAINDTSASYKNCKVKPIGSIAGVAPDTDGNIDIYGIYPVEVQILAGGLTLNVPTITKADLCASVKQLPPLIPQQNYYTSVLTAEAPEWSTWPQFQIQTS